MPEKRVSAHVALGETVMLALDTLRSHKLRSFLTLLGIILAVATLVGVQSVVAGLNLYVSDKIANLGANAYIIDRFGIITNMDEFTKAQKRPRLVYDDYLALSDEMKTAREVAAIEAVTQDVRGGGDLFEDANILGITPNYLDVRAITIAKGRSFSQSDNDHRTNVCVLGNDIAVKLFPNVDPLGRTVRVATQEFQVIGVANVIGTVLGQSQDQFVMVPFLTYEKIWHSTQNSITMFVSAVSPEMIDASMDEVRMILRARHHLQYRAADDFGMIGSSSITGLWKELTGNIFAMAIGLTSVFMVVGGIVIMNIMLAAVTERTREIGIRKALGARRSHILTQFLVESAVLAAAGGIIGILFASGVTWFVRAVLEFPMSTPIIAVVISLTLSTVVGLFFGIYPAMRAAKLDPIEALRAEA